MQATSDLETFLRTREEGQAFDKLRPSGDAGERSAGHEQAGHRPALVLSPKRYNGARGMMLCCPLTSRIKGYPFEVVVSDDPPSAVLSDQIKALDWRARKASQKGAVPAPVREKLGVLLGIC